jgi:manganese/iron transport system ATP-binding protein
MRIILILSFWLKMLEVCDLAVSYRDTWAINGVSFCLQPGQLTGLFGPNGAGKSTLIKGILGLIPVAQGIIRYDSQPLKQHLKKVAYVPQRNKIDWDYPVTVEKVVMMGRIPATGWFRKPSRNSHEIVNHALERVGMMQFRKHQIRELSGGQQQRVFLARAIAQQADLFFFDEPFNNIDCRTEEIIFDVFQDLKQQQKTVLVISHDLGETSANYDQLLLLNQKIIAVGNHQQVLTNQNIQKAYGKMVNI